MVDKLKCPFCGAELKNACAQVIYFCPNDECHKAKDWYASKQVWQALIDGKKAQRQLRTAKDRCVKKIKAKEREIANYLNGISVRNKEIQNLREQLQTTQDALKAAKEYYVIVRGYGKEQHYISYSTGVDWFWNWDLDHAEPFDTIQDAKDQIRAAKIPHAHVMKVRRLTEITSITKQEK